MGLTMNYELLQGDTPDIVGYLIRRDGPQWLNDIAAEIDRAQRDAAGIPKRKRKARATAIEYGALMCTKRDQMKAVIERGSF